MSKEYTLSMPVVDNFRVKYYFSNEPNVFSARVFPPHVHDELEIYILLEGDTSFMVDNNLYKLAPGDVVISRPNEMHNCILNATSVHKHLCFWCDTACEYVFSRFTESNDCPTVISPRKAEADLLLSLYEQLEDASKTDDQIRQFYLQLQILDIISKNASHEESPSALPVILKNILDDVDRSFAEIGNLEFFTNKYSISQSTLNRLFKQHLKTTPKIYLETKRLAHSRMLLKRGKSVFEACMQSGFSDYSNYIRLFRKRFGITPKQYRNAK